MRSFAYVAAALGVFAMTLYPLSLADDVYPLSLLAVAAAVGLALSLINREWVLVGPALGILILGYAVALQDAEVTLDRFVVAFAVGTLLVAELIDVIPLLGRRPRPERAVVIDHTRHILGVTAMSLVVCAAVVVAARSVTGGPAVLAVLAAVCGLVATFIAVMLAQRAVEGDL